MILFFLLIFKRLSTLNSLLNRAWIYPRYLPNSRKWFFIIWCHASWRSMCRSSYPRKKRLRHHGFLRQKIFFKIKKPNYLNGFLLKLLIVVVTLALIWLLLLLKSFLKLLRKISRLNLWVSRCGMKIKLINSTCDFVFSFNL